MKLISRSSSLLSAVSASTTFFPMASPSDDSQHCMVVADKYKQEIGRILKQKDKEIKQKDKEIKKLKELGVVKERALEEKDYKIINLMAQLNKMEANQIEEQYEIQMKQKQQVQHELLKAKRKNKELAVKLRMACLKPQQLQSITR